MTIYTSVIRLWYNKSFRYIIISRWKLKSRKNINQILQQYISEYMSDTYKKWLLGATYFFMLSIHDRWEDVIQDRFPLAPSTSHTIYWTGMINTRAPFSVWMIDKMCYITRINSGGTTSAVKEHHLCMWQLLPCAHPWSPPMGLLVSPQDTGASRVHLSLNLSNRWYCLHEIGFIILHKWQVTKYGVHMNLWLI